jgi:hypothetical protein
MLKKRELQPGDSEMVLSVFLLSVKLNSLPTGFRQLENLHLFFIVFLLANREGFLVCRVKTQSISISASGCRLQG